MQTAQLKTYWKKHRRKLLVFYICWCVIKGLLLLLLGARLFG